MTLGVFPVSSQFPCKSWREKVYIHLTSDLISSDETIHINTTRSLGNTVWQTVSRPKSQWARHQLLFFSLLHYQIKCETDKGIIWTLACRLQVDRRRLILAVLNKMNHFIFFFFFPETAVWAVETVLASPVSHFHRSHSADVLVLSILQWVLQ